MSVDRRFITHAHIDWAMDNRVIITEGECGFGRPCVGVSDGSKWVDWRATTGAPDYKPIPGEYDGWVPNDAYHKHDCVAVLVHNDNAELAWIQLAAWLNAIILNGWTVLHETRTPADAIDALMGGMSSVRLVKS